MTAPLDSQLLAAHASKDMPALVRLYTQAADTYQAAQDIDAACFYLTHAYVFALQLGDPSATPLSKRLSDHGRDLPITD